MQSILPKIIDLFRRYIIKSRVSEAGEGVVKKLPRQDFIDLNVQITLDKFIANGINPNNMKNTNQIENVMNQIDTPKVNVNPGVEKTNKATVYDLKGNKIDTSKGIMGGEEVGMFDNIFNKMQNEMKGLKEVKPIDELQNYTKSKEDIVQDLVDQKFGKGYFDTVDETEEEIRKRILKNNEKGIASMKKKLDDPEEKADGGRIGLMAGTVPKVLKLLKNKKKVQSAVDDIFPTGDYKMDAQMAADSLVENNPKIFGGKLYDDLDQDTQMQIYSTVLRPITNKMATQMKLQKATRPEKTLQSMKEGKGIDMSDPEIADEFSRFMKETDPKGYKELEQKVELSNFNPKGRKKNADGGIMRAGYAGGGMGRRGFLKLMGTLGAGIAGIKSGILGLGKGAGKTVAKEVAQQTTSSMPPPYFFKLAEKIKMMGNDATATTERVIAKSLKSKDGKSEYLLEEDMVTGDTIIKKINKEGDEMITDVQIMELRKGEDVITKDGKAMKTPDEYEEVTEANARIEGDVYNDPYYSDGIEVDEMKKIIDEVDDKVPSIKYASGGLAYMLGE
jgi:hypothetical protein